VQLLDSANYENYTNGRGYRYHGGYATTSPVRLAVPRAGIELAGGRPVRIEHHETHQEYVLIRADACPPTPAQLPVVSVAWRTEKASSPEKTRYTVRPSALIHFVGNALLSPGPTSHSFVKKAVVQGPHGSGAS
jgi:hypothetical protein